MSEEILIIFSIESHPWSLLSQHRFPFKHAHMDGYIATNDVRLNAVVVSVADRIT